MFAFSTTPLTNSLGNESTAGALLLLILELNEDETDEDELLPEAP